MCACSVLIATKSQHKEYIIGSDQQTYLQLFLKLILRVIEVSQKCMQDRNIILQLHAQIATGLNFFSFMSVQKKNQFLKKMNESDYQNIIYLVAESFVMNLHSKNSLCRNSKPNKLLIAHLNMTALVALRYDYVYNTHYSQENALHIYSFKLLIYKWGLNYAIILSFAKMRILVACFYL